MLDNTQNPAHQNHQGIFAGVEAGGTKFVCGIADGNGKVIETRRIDTRSPEETIRECQVFFTEMAAGYGKVLGVGIASFGPLDLDPHSRNYGQIVSTPKPLWSGINLKTIFAEVCQAPVAIDTDVNCAALAEGLHGAARDVETHCYITIGTGIGVGIVQNDTSMLKSGHAECGHMRIPRFSGDTFAGTCPYHGDCVEGMACGPAMAQRWNTSAEDLPDDHPAWDMEAHYIAALCNNLIYTVRPGKIVIGGGVMQRETLYARVRQKLASMLAGYALSSIELDVNDLIVAPGLVDTSPGLTGAFEMARNLATSHRTA